MFEGNCEGKPIASAEVATGNIAIKTVDVALPSMQGVHDLCLKFGGDHRSVLWAIDRVQLVPVGAAH